VSVDLYIVLTMTAPLLGSTPLNKDIYGEYIASKHPVPVSDDELAAEVETVEESMTKGMTGFHRTDSGLPFVFDYTIKGFFKDACGMLRRLDGTQSKKLTNYKRVIDGLIFVQPRQIVIATDKPITTNTRPLRAQTAQGERIALACSEQIATGARLEFTITLLDGGHVALVNEWLDYGRLRGLGAWRNAAWGTFDWTERR
jgi:hypothetical protein